MKPQFQERHQDYVVGPPPAGQPPGLNQDGRLASVAAGALVEGIELTMEPDAPFLLRGRAYRVSYDNLDSRTQVGLQNLSLRYSGPDQDFRSNLLVPQGLLMPYGGQSGAWKPVYPQILYPARSTMFIDVLNTGSTALTNLTLYFRGVKLFPWGTNPGYTYPERPAKSALLPYVYPIGNPNDPANPQGSVQNLLAADSRQLLTWQNQPDSAFVLRALQAGPSYAPFGLEVFITLRDENRKAYSNAPVHFEVLAGPSIGNYQTGAGGSMTAIGTGNSAPSIVYPEIYVPPAHLLYYDIQRIDSGYAGAATIPNFPINLIGARVYQR